MSKPFVFLLLCVFFFKSLASTIDKAYKALNEYDYFKAKKLFYAQLKKSPTEAAYGLATIYYRQDNPFHKLDSAYKYIQISKNNYKALPPEKVLKLKTSYQLNDSSLTTLHDSIAYKTYLVYLKNNRLVV